MEYVVFAIGQLMLVGVAWSIGVRHGARALIRESVARKANTP